LNGVPRYTRPVTELDLPRLRVPRFDDDLAGDGAHRGYWARQDRLTKPPRSLGRLEELGAILARLQAAPVPSARPAACLLFASDHPVTAHGVSAYPAAVTRAMVGNFAGGGAASAVMCRHLGIGLQVIDVGVAGGAVDAPAGFYRREAVADMAAGDMVTTDALPAATGRAAIEAGRAAIDRLGADVRLVALGEMGIGNTTCAAAVAAAILGRSGASLVGPGTGVAGRALSRKIEVVATALRRVRHSDSERVAPARALAALGGRDIAALVGAMGRAVERRILVMVDGFIASAAALVLVDHDPTTAAGLVFAHRSREPGHSLILDHLGARPLLELEMALGEATGALAAIPLVDLACAVHAGMATFESAGVPDKAP
jgi:nicotinate-nucleotide--dimethylbenzimidazole phosphoribosyltransferase